MEVLSYSADNSPVETFNRSTFPAQSELLWILYADKIPPHIGFSSNGKYYSLKVNGKDTAQDVEHLLSVINGKKIKTLVYQIHTDFEISIGKVFEKYDRAVSGKTTCLEPVKRYLSLEAETIHDLLFELDKRSLILSVTGIHIDSSFNGIPYYETKDIHEYLNSLKNVRGK